MAQRQLQYSKLKERFFSGAYECPLSDGKLEIVVVILWHFSDNERERGDSRKG
jgi:hypothetical protein